MSTQISEAFVKQFQADVHLAYQQTGSKLKNMVRSQNNVKGSSTVFKKSARASLPVRRDTAWFRL